MTHSCSAGQYRYQSLKSSMGRTSLLCSPACEIYWVEEKILECCELVLSWLTASSSVKSVKTCGFYGNANFCPPITISPLKAPEQWWSGGDGAGCRLGILSNVAAKKKLFFFFTPQLDWSLISWQDLWFWFIAFLLTQLVKLCSAVALRTRTHTHTLKSKLSKGIFGPSAVKWLPSDVTSVYSCNPARLLMSADSLVLTRVNLRDLALWEAFPELLPVITFSLEIHWKETWQ